MIELFLLPVALILVLCVHEEGHWVAARVQGFRPKFALTKLGPCTRWDAGRASSRQRFVVSAAGPAANVVFAGEAWGMGWHTAATCSLMLGLASLLPLGPSDGTNMLRAARGTR